MNERIKSIISLFSLTLIFSCILSVSCKEKPRTDEARQNRATEIVLISTNAPENYRHYLANDSLGKIITDTLGPSMTFLKNGFTYVDDMSRERSWLPKPNTVDTLVISGYSKFLELAFRNPYTAMESTFLVQVGDTIVFDFKHGIPTASVLNREVSNVELNYNNERLNALFNNKYSSHTMILMHIGMSEDIENIEQRTVNYYYQAEEDAERELAWLDSLKIVGLLSPHHYTYRKNALAVLRERNKQVKSVKDHLFRMSSLSEAEGITPPPRFDLTKADSLMKFSFFREYLKQISQYELPFNSYRTSNSGGSYIDSRIRFDSILADERFDQTALNYLLHDAYRGIALNYKVKDKNIYFEKLVQNTTDPQRIKELKDKYNLDFSRKEDLLLTNLEGDTLTFQQVLEANQGYWLYVDFWASWCAPCRKVMPHSKKMMEELEEQKARFIFLSLKDDKNKWKQAILKDGIESGEHYYIENQLSSQVMEDLEVQAIPRYFIYDPRGKLINLNPQPPGKGAKEQLKAYIRTE